ncbi:MAG: cobalt-precorrin-6A reductase [Spirulina sp. DLM2.Bin59]|nr:MAG: cobalt-precorrin-6A reductase [Spirulina sp. DLM2.Bin59]
MGDLKRVLILGGSGDAVGLAARVADLPGLRVITSLAGRTRQPLVTSPHTRIGGFGGVAGLVDYLRSQSIDLLIDATHPFAAQISHHAATAAATVGLPHLMLIRPAWEESSGDQWRSVDSHAAAAAQCAQWGGRIFLTIGRQELAAFAHLQDHWFLMRMIDPPHPDAAIPPGQVLLARGPFALSEERSLLQDHGIEAIVSKNSGGAATYSKIIAARELGLPVIMIQRPPMPRGDRATNIETALSWLQQHR